MNLVVDSNIWIAALNLDDPNHSAATSFFEELRRRNDRAFTPITVLWDIGAAIDHPFKESLRKGRVLPELDVPCEFVNVDFSLFEKGWRPDLRISVKGPDRILLSCAIMLNAALVTNDLQLLKYSHTARVAAQTADQYLRPSR